MPVRVDLSDLSQLAGLNAVQHFAIPGSIVILQSHLVMLTRALHRVANATTSFDGERHAFLAINVMSAFEHGRDVIGMEGERCRDDDGIDIVGVEELAMIVINGRILTGDLAARCKPRLINIAKSSKANTGHAQKSSHELLSAAADTDDAEIYLVRGRAEQSF